MSIQDFDFSAKRSVGLLIAAGGFEKRALSFVRRARIRDIKVERAILLRYMIQEHDNQPNFERLRKRVRKFTKHVKVVDVGVGAVDRAVRDIATAVATATTALGHQTAIVDVSGMAHILICACMKALDSNGLETLVVYTEADDYFPRRSNWKEVLRAVQDEDFAAMAPHLQTAGLKDIQVPTEFKGNTRPGYPSCLFLLAGYEPNRVTGLVDDYSPSAIVVFYGKSPRRKLKKRQDLSQALHQHVFDGWRHKQILDLTTFRVDDVLNALEREYAIVRPDYDVALTSQCSKMQTYGTYLFWRRHPEIQLVFTVAVKYEPRRSSVGEGVTFQVEHPEGSI